MFWYICVISVVNILVGYGAAVYLGYISVNFDSKKVWHFVRSARLTGVTLVYTDEPDEDEASEPDPTSEVDEDAPVVSSGEAFATLDGLLLQMLEEQQAFRQRLLEIERRFHDPQIAAHTESVIRIIEFYHASTGPFIARQTNILAELRCIAWPLAKLGRWSDLIKAIVEDQAAQLEVSKNSFEHRMATLSGDGTTRKLLGDLGQLLEAQHRTCDRMIESRADLAMALEVRDQDPFATTTDDPSEVGTRPALDLFLDDWCRRETNRTRFLSIGFVDLDRWRAFNLEHGHRHGDRIAQLLAAITKEELTGADRAYRYRGTTLAVLCPDAAPHSLAEILERVRNKIETGGFQLGTQRLAVTVSCGVSSSNPDDSPRDICERGLAALEAAKLCGRNRIFLDLPRGAITAPFTAASEQEVVHAS